MKRQCIPKKADTSTKESKKNSNQPIKIKKDSKSIENIKTKKSNVHAYVSTHTTLEWKSFFGVIIWAKTHPSFKWMPGILVSLSFDYRILNSKC